MELTSVDPAAASVVGVPTVTEQNRTLRSTSVPRPRGDDPEAMKASVLGAKRGGAPDLSGFRAFPQG